MNQIQAFSLLAFVSISPLGCGMPSGPDTADVVWSEFSDMGKESSCGAWMNGEMELQLQFLEEILSLVLGFDQRRFC